MFLEKPLLDFCRIKKIFDKGFGFLTSLYFEEPVFFHFNNVKDKAIKAKLENLNRSDVYSFFTSVKLKGKRKVNKLWFDIKDISPELFPDFVEKIITELNNGKTNVFEIAYAIKHLRENNIIDKEKFREILNSTKVLSTPSVIISMLTEYDEINTNRVVEINNNLQSGKFTVSEWTKKILEETSE